MTSSGFSSTVIGWMAIATGMAGIFAMIFIALFYAVGSPFGTLNDIGNGLMALLSGGLAWALYAYDQEKLTTLDKALPILALIGMVVAIIGSVLVIFKFTDWILAGLYTATGYALIGLWVIGLNYAARQSDFLPQGLSMFGLVLGAMMLFGFAAVPGLLKGIDSLEGMHPVINVLWQAASLGWLFLYPMWCIWLGRWILVQAK